MMNMTLNITCGPHCTWRILELAYFEDIVWLASIFFSLWLLRKSAERSMEHLSAFTLLAQATVAAEEAVVAAALPAREAFSVDAQRFAFERLAPVYWTVARAVLRCRGQRWGFTGNPVSVIAALSAKEVSWKFAPRIIWAQLLGAWLGIWYIQWVSLPRKEWGFCVPPSYYVEKPTSPSWSWFPAAVLEGFGAFVEELCRRGLRPSDACALKLPRLLCSCTHAAAHAVTSMAAARRTGAIFNPAVAFASVHACTKPLGVRVAQRFTPLPCLVCAFSSNGSPPVVDVVLPREYPYSPGDYSNSRYVVGPFFGALLAVVVAPALRCAVEDYLHTRYPDRGTQCNHPMR